MTNCWCWWLSISSWIDSVIDWVWLELWVWSELTGIKEHGVTILKFEANDRGEGTVDVDNAAFEQSLSFSFLLGVGVDNLKKQFLSRPTTLGINTFQFCYEILNIKNGWKHYTSYIIHNVLNDITRVVLSADFDV